MQSNSLWRMFAVSLAVVFAGTALVWGLVIAHPGTHSSLASRFSYLTEHLRAPGDENTMTIDSSTSAGALQMKYDVQTELMANKSNQEIIQDMVKKYGPDVYAAPPLKGVGTAAWLPPLGFLVVAVFLALTALARRSKERSVTGRRQTESAPETKEEPMPLQPAQTRLRDYL